MKQKFIQLLIDQKLFVMKLFASSIVLWSAFIFILSSAAIITSCSDDEGPEEIPLTISGIAPLSGPKNTIVTITGTGFSPETAKNIVTLNDIVCPVTTFSPSELKVTIPAGAGSGRFVVKVNSDTRETPQFTYLNSSDEIPLVISGMLPSSGPKTTIVTITGSGFSSNVVDNIVILNDIACPVIAASATELKVTIPFKAGSGKLVVKVDGKSGETPPFTYIPQVRVTTLAGSIGGEGKVFNKPGGVAIDKDTNVYVSDLWNHRIKKVTQSGIVTTIAGDTRGNVFDFPNGVAVDKEGNVYVVDYYTHQIKKIAPSGVVSTFAGSGGGDNDKFYFPGGIAVDESGNVYVGDQNNFKVKKITPSGVVSTLAGSTQGDGEKFDLPFGVAVDKAGNVYVADSKNNKIKKISPLGVVSTLAGSTAGDGDKFNVPRGVAVDAAGNVYVADMDNHKIKKITPSGVVSTLAGSTQGDGEKFNAPGGVAVDVAGNVYVADTGNHKIKKITQE